MIKYLQNARNNTDYDLELSYISAKQNQKSNKGISNVGKIIQYPHIKQRIQVSTQ